MSSGAQAGCLEYAEELCHLDERSSRQRIWSRGPHWPREVHLTDYRLSSTVTTLRSN